MPDQLEALEHDVDILDFQLEMQNQCGIDLTNTISAATIERTIEGASTLTVIVEDDVDRTIQNSGRLGRHVDVELDGLFFTLVGVKKQARQLTLVFEDQAINVLRYYNTFIQADRSKVTRAEFVLRMIREVKEVPLTWVIPELKVIQEVSDVQPGQVIVNPDGTPMVAVKTDKATKADAKKNRNKGITPPAPQDTHGLTVKSVAMDTEQWDNAVTIINTGVAMKMSTKVIVCSIMTAIDESVLRNLVGGDRDSVGVFQQRRSMGWPATRNVATDAAAFFNAAQPIDKNNPGISYNDLCQSVQHSGTPYAYGQYYDEAALIVHAYGLDVKSGLVDPKYTVSGGNNMQAPDTIPDYSTGAFFFTRGTLSTDSIGETLLTKEDSWTCIKRLADEVNWRAFCVSGVIYFIDDKDLFASKPFMVISEDTDGIDWIDYDYDEGKRKATVTVTAHLSRWSAPPGCTVQCINSGIVNGKWLVQDISRSLYDHIATITMIKPQPVLPEPTTSSTSKIMDGNTGNKKAQPGGARAGSEGPLGSVQNKIVSYARQQLGVTYVYGAEKPGVAIDCSGLAQAAYSAANISIPRVAQDQFNAGTPIYPPDVLKPADLVFFGSDSSHIEHVGIYIGNGAMIDAPHTGAVVRVDDGFTSWDNPPYAGAVRLWQQ